MASLPANGGPVHGRVDATGRLLSADAPLEQLQRDAGAGVGDLLAIPQLAGIARLALTLGIPVSRPAVAASRDCDLDLLVTATPEGQDVVLSITGWTARPPRGSLVGATYGQPDETQDNSEPGWHFACDAALRLTEADPEFLTFLGASAGLGSALTELLRFEEEPDGGLPILRAVAERQGFARQRAVSRRGRPGEVTLTAEPSVAVDGSFDGYRGRAEPTRKDTHSASAMAAPGASARDADNGLLDQALRSPLDRIIAAADRIVERSDGPLRSDYAAYASDIAAASRHLLSVIRSMSEESAATSERVDLAQLADEAVGLVTGEADARHVDLLIEEGETSVPASGEPRAIRQILVNILGNAIRHSPPGGTVAIVFHQDGDKVRLTVADQGPGIAKADQARIFEKFERAGSSPGSAGLGLAISRRLARSMGGEVELESAPGEGARFTLILPA